MATVLDLYNLISDTASENVKNDYKSIAAGYSRISYMLFTILENLEYNKQLPVGFIDSMFKRVESSIKTPFKDPPSKKPPKDSENA